MMSVYLPKAHPTNVNQIHSNALSQAQKIMSTLACLVTNQLLLKCLPLKVWLNCSREATSKFYNNELQRTSGVGMMNDNVQDINMMVYRTFSYHICRLFLCKIAYSDKRLEVVTS